ncbi:opioid growth factor receptor-like protein 1 [Hyperolius riggenbachi]|uniref:opioid growth factor receptor-like protein 1 n=1 Tax=Hyperolius riggenbachi TaxID=752182 RepID=UPI0035A299C3
MQGESENFETQIPEQVGQEGFQLQEVGREDLVDDVGVCCTEVVVGGSTPRRRPTITYDEFEEMEEEEAHVAVIDSAAQAGAVQSDLVVALASSPGTARDILGAWSWRKPPNMEEWSSDCDSTWEDEEEGEGALGNKESDYQFKYPGESETGAAKDLQNYRHRYAHDTSYQQNSHQSEDTPNLDFYQNKKSFEPDGVYIDDLLQQWKGDYQTMENNNSYIAWLFPLREPSRNPYAKPMTLKEIEVMNKDKHIRRKFLAAYKLMLGFYGIELVDQKTGRVARAAENWEERFKNLNDHSHNNLRITRILKCLGELGYERFQAPLVRFFLEETLCHKILHNVRRSALDYFIFTVRDKNERKELVHFAWENFTPQEKFIWEPVAKPRKYKPPPENKQEAKVCHSEKKEESDDDTKPNGYMNRPQDGDKIDIKDDHDYQNNSIPEYTLSILRLEKKSFQESITLSERLEDKGKLPSEETNTCSKAMSENTDLPSNNAGDSVNGIQLPTEDKMRKLDGGGEAPHEGSSDHDHVATSTERHQEDHREVGVDGENLEKNIQQDSAHKDISKTKFSNQSNLLSPQQNLTSKFLGNLRDNTSQLSFSGIPWMKEKFSQAISHLYRTKYSMKKSSERPDDDMKETGRGDSDDDLKETGRGDSDDDMKEPGRGDSDNDMKEPGREDIDEDIKEAGKNNTKDNRYYVNKTGRDRQDKDVFRNPNNSVSPPGLSRIRGSTQMFPLSYRNPLKFSSADDSEDDMKEPAREDSEDDTKESAWEDNKDIIKEPAREDRAYDKKEPKREDFEDEGRS